MHPPPKAVLKKLKAVSSEQTEIVPQEKVVPAEPEIPVHQTAQVKINGTVPAGDSETSLPILETFKTFLYTERKKYHRRIIALFLSFFSSILLILVTSVLFVFYLGRGINRDFANIQKTVDEYGQSYSQLSQKMSSVLQEINIAHSKLENDYAEKNKILAYSSQTFSDKIKSYEDELQKTKEMLTEIKKELAYFSNIITKTNEVISSKKTLAESTVPSDETINTNQIAMDINTNSNNAITLRIITGEDPPSEILWQIPIVE